MAKVTDLTGKEFYRLTVIERAENSPKGDVRWLCKCQCGKQLVIIGRSLKSHKSKSCGCLRRDNAKLANLGRRGRLTHVNSQETYDFMLEE